MVVARAFIVSVASIVSIAFIVSIVSIKSIALAPRRTELIISIVPIGSIKSIASINSPAKIYKAEFFLAVFCGGNEIKILFLQ